MALLFVILLLTIASANCNVAKGSVKILLYNESDFENPLPLQSVNLQDVHIDESKEVKIICHGVSASSAVKWYRPMITALLRKNCTVIGVDWEAYAYDSYLTANFLANEIGRVLANFVLDLNKCRGISLGGVHFIGHSLGAHISGIAGKRICKDAGIKIGRITGLDPAGPLFETALRQFRLDRDDATFVDVIHTNALVAGITTPIGHVDFYPDGGSNQNSCFILDATCSHNIVTDYFIESINSSGFVAENCASWPIYTMGLCKYNQKVLMGENTDREARGLFFLRTNNGAPYARC